MDHKANTEERPTANSDANQIQYAVNFKTIGLRYNGLGFQNVHGDGLDLEDDEVVPDRDDDVDDPYEALMHGRGGGDADSGIEDFDAEELYENFADALEPPFVESLGARIAKQIGYALKKLAFLAAYMLFLVYFFMFTQAVLIEQNFFRKDSIKKLGPLVPNLVLKAWIAFLDGAQILQNGLHFVCPQFPLVRMPPEIPFIQYFSEFLGINYACQMVVRLDKFIFTDCIHFVTEAFVKILG